MTWAQQREMAAAWFPSAELVPTDHLVDGLRAVKDDGEVARIEAAAAVATEALDRIRRRLLDGPTEAEFGLELDTEMRRLGAAGPSFETIVASGPNGAKPHHRPGSRRVADGDLVVVDYGALVDGYCSDMTRTVVVGSPHRDPGPHDRRGDRVAAGRRRRGAGGRHLRRGRPGLPLGDRGRRAGATRSCTARATASGSRSTRRPRVSFASADTLATGYVVTVEPGVYLPEHGGVRIEDTVVVTDDGCYSLTHAPKDPAWPSRPTN